MSQQLLLAIQPAAGQTVSATGQIIVWVNDEGAPFVAPGEQVNPTTGAITTVGDRAAKAADGYLFEPALYIAPATVETGGQPHFPDFIKGQFNNTGLLGNVTNGPAYDPLPPGSPNREDQTQMVLDLTNMLPNIFGMLLI